VLGNDIDFAGIDYLPIKLFNGIIDGAGYGIKNLTLAAVTQDDNVGLIEENHGMIVNFSVKQLVVKLDLPKYYNTIYIGGIAARNYGHIINCKVQASGTNIMYIMVPSSYAGGIAGFNGGNIRRCENWIYISTSGIVGGIAGFNSTDGTVTDCFNAETLAANEYDESIAVVGIVGENKGLVTDCANHGRVFDRNRWEYIEG
jgi:hypothetical protein